MRVTFAAIVKLLALIANKLIEKIQYYYQLYNEYKGAFAKGTEGAQLKPTFAQTQQELFNKSMAKYNEFYAREPCSRAVESKISPRETEDENANIDPILYDFEARKTVFQDPDNLYEKQWKSRALYSSTPRGNVLMYYNPFSLSFLYYSDEQIIPYSILQKLAKKYVVMFRCKNFYIDVEGRPNNKIFELLHKEEDALNGKKKKIEDITKIVDNGRREQNADVFASLKNYRTDEGSKLAKGTFGSRLGAFAKGTNKNVNSKKGPNANFSNKFVRIGKINEFNILALPPCKKVQAVNELLFGAKPVSSMNDFFDDLEIVEHENSFNPESEKPAVTSSYAMFKKLKTKAE
jgi:hypothetical protein